MRESLALPGVAPTSREWVSDEALTTRDGVRVRVRNTLVTTTEQLATMARVLTASPRIVYDCETSGLTPALGAQIIGHAFAVRAADDYVATWYVPVRHSNDASMPQLDPEVAARAVRDVLTSPGDCGFHHAKFDLSHLRADGVRVARRVLDTSIRAVIANENERSFGLKPLAAKHLFAEAEREQDEVGDFLRRDAAKLGIPFRTRRRGEDDPTGGEPSYLERFGHARTPIVLEGRYACRDVLYTALLLDHFEWTERSFPALHAREHEVGLALHDMEWHGLPLDADEVRRAQVAAQEECGIYLDIVRRHAGSAFEVNDANVRELLFETLKLPPPKLTKKGKEAQQASRESGSDDASKLSHFAVDKEVREILAAQHPEHRELILALNSYARAQKIASTYTSALLRYYSPRTGSIHPSYNQLEARDEGGVPVTGRLSSSEPNIQNQASKAMHLATCGCDDCVGKWRKGALIGPERKPGETRSISVRRYFTVPEGYVRAYIDFSQIELRILAWLSRDPILLDAYARDLDIHAITAEQVTGGDRAIAKQVNFGNSYGMTEIGLARRMQGYANDPEGTREKAKKVLDAFFATYAGIPRFRREFASTMRAHRGEFVSSFGRPRRIAEVTSKVRWERERGERMMMSSIVSGTAADLMKEVLIGVRRWLAQADARARVVQTIHDELVYDLPADNAAALLAGIMHITTTWPVFENAGVPIRASMALTTTRWEAKKEAVLDPEHAQGWRYK